MFSPLESNRKLSGNIILARIKKTKWSFPSFWTNIKNCVGTYGIFMDHVFGHALKLLLLSQFVEYDFDMNTLH